MDDPAQPAIEAPTDALSAVAFLLKASEMDADISELLSDDQLARLGQEVCDNYDRDLASREDWQKVAEKALADMAKCDFGTKDYPWAKASNVHYPLLPYAVMQFNARAYPAIVKGDEAVAVKVVGADKGLPKQGPNGQPLMQIKGIPIVITPQGPVAITPQGPMPVPPDMQPEPMWDREPGAKAKRAGRVRDYMNSCLFYGMDNWEGDTDALIFQLAAIGCAFRKVWSSEGKQHSVFVPAINLVVHNDARTLEDAPQITERIDGVYPHQIKRDIATGRYRDMDIAQDDKAPRLLIEQQCHYDLDGDGMPEPYVVTVDHKDRHILRVVPDFTADDVKIAKDRVAYITRRRFYVKYEFLPHPEGKFYNVGLAHMLEQYSEVINTIVNQMLDASHAATAGGGFIASGLRIQGAGQSSALKWQPGEYKTVAVSGAALREGIVERTFPTVSPVMFQLLDLILGAAKDIASIKDVLSGDASNTGQVGTTLAMIEQGLQVFTAIYKRVYRGLKAEFTLLYENIGKFGTEETAKDYAELLDDPQADFAADFNGANMDIRPVSDPNSVTQMQRLSRAQFVLGTVETLQAAGGDVREALRRAYDAAGIDDIDKLLPERGPDPMLAKAGEIKLAGEAAKVDETKAKTDKAVAEAQAIMATVHMDTQQQQLDALMAGHAAAA